MGGRLALVVGSECVQRGKLGFVAERARDLFDVLTDPDVGEWEPAGDRSGPLLDPTTADLAEAVTAAFTEASARQATLLFAFVGHGQAVGEQNPDYYLLTRESGDTLRPQSAFALVAQFRAELAACSGLDGLVCLIDACEAGQGALGAGRSWLDAMLPLGGRMEVMTASALAEAYDGCFTRTLVAAARRGSWRYGEDLSCADLKPGIGSECSAQTPVLLSFDGVSVVPDSTDRGLYLVANVLRRGTALFGTAAAGVIDQLTRGVLITGTVREAYEQLRESDGARLRLVVGPAGAGKSTLVSLLLRPEYVGDDVARLNVHAAVFLQPSSTRQTIAAALETQLLASLEGYPDAVQAVEQGSDPEEYKRLDALEARVLRPLERCRQPGARVRIVIDGLDQPEGAARSDVFAALEALADPGRAELSHLRVITTGRDTLDLPSTPVFASSTTITLPKPQADDLITVIQSGRRRRDLDNALFDEIPADGGWLIARLLSEIDDAYLP